MKFQRKIQANPNTKILAWWFALTQEEFNSIQANNKPNFTPSEKSTVVSYTYGDWSVKDSTKFMLVKDNLQGRYSITYISFTDPTEKIIELISL